MKICFITPTFFPVHGGSEQAIFELARTLAHKHEITLITLNKKGAKAYERMAGFEIYRIPFIPWKGLDAISAQASLLAVFPRLFRKKRFDLIHAFHPYMIGGAAVLLKNRYRLPLMMSLYGWETYDPLRPIPKAIWPYLAWVMNQSDAVTAPSIIMEKHARAQGAKKEIHIIPHGISRNLQQVNSPTRKTKNQALFKKLGIQNNHKIVFSLQRLVPRKGLDTLIESIPIVLKKEPNTTFVIGGKGPLLSKLTLFCKQKMIEKSVRFTGYIGDDQLHDYYTIADIFALPSLFEAFGVVYVDALSQGVPVVTTACGGPEDIIQSHNGILVPVGDVRAFAGAIVQALRKKWNHANISRSSRQKYDWVHIAELYEKIYAKILT